jgi:hypothetical protein
MYTLPLLVCWLAAPFQGADDQPKKEPDEVLLKAQAVVADKLKEWKGEGGRVQGLDEPYLRDLFPNYRFVAVHYPIWPVARATPAPLKHQNLFAVTKDGVVTHLTATNGLEQFFKANLGSTDPPKVVRSWLRLSTELIQDGFFKFKILDDIKDTSAASSFSNYVGTAEVVPEMGNKGYLKVAIRFDRVNKLTRVEEENKVVRGIRPRCQARLLLHADPVVRAIAEQDLLVLGQSSREYLEDQRRLASPELRLAIDRVWRQIIAEGR